MSSRADHSSHVYHDWQADDELSTSIVVGVSKATDRPPDDLGPPLSTVIDPDALEALLAPRDGDNGTANRITFTLDSCTVTITSDENLAHIAVEQSEITPE